MKRGGLAALDHERSAAQSLAWFAPPAHAAFARGGPSQTLHRIFTLKRGKPVVGVRQAGGEHVKKALIEMHATGI